MIGFILGLVLALGLGAEKPAFMRLNSKSKRCYLYRKSNLAVF